MSFFLRNCLMYIYVEEYERNKLVELTATKWNENNNAGFKLNNLIRIMTCSLQKFIYV